MPGTCAVIWVNCFAVTVPNCPSNAMFQSWPYRLGVPTRRSRFAPNVPAPATAATATARPSMALRTGTLARPRSRVEREPHAGDGGERRAGPRQAARRAAGGAPTAPRGPGGARPACRHAGHRDAGGEQHHDRGRPGGEHAGVHADAGIRFGEPGGADRGQRGGGDRDRDRAEGAGDRGRGRLGHARGEQLAAGHAERRQGAVVLARRSAASVAATWPTMSSAVSARASANSARAIACGRISRSIGRRLRRLVGDEDLPAGARVPLGQAFRGRA